MCSRTAGGLRRPALRVRAGSAPAPRSREACGGRRHGGDAAVTAQGDPPARVGSKLPLTSRNLLALSEPLLPAWVNLRFRIAAQPSVGRIVLGTPQRDATNLGAGATRRGQQARPGEACEWSPGARRAAPETRRSGLRGPARRNGLAVSCRAIGPRRPG